MNTLPKDDFTIKQFKEVWNNYIAYLKKKGEKLLLSMLVSLDPKIEDSTIYIILPNARIQNDIENNKHKILHFLREKLNHYALDFAYEINEEEENKIAYTSQEKYDFLKNVNPLLMKLRSEFDLDV